MQFCTGGMVLPPVRSGKTPGNWARSMADWRAEGVVDKGREGEGFPEWATRGVGGVAVQEAVMAWRRTLLFPRRGVQVVADNWTVVMVETVPWLRERLR